jgi:DHA1 family bicyclomycin/chloramphenicol resistance-like MFS transporter
LLWGVSLFLVATLGCIIAPTIETFLAARMAQASIVVAMVLSRAAIRDVVPTNQAASMISYVTMGMAVVPMIGPAFGGVLDEVFGWKANFWILFVLGLPILALTYIDLGETKRPSGHSLFRQFQEYPELLKSQRFWGYSLATACSSGSFFAYLGGAPFVATEVFDMSPAKMGVYFGAPALGYFIGNFISGRYSSRYGVNKMVLAGCITCTIGILLSLSIFLVHTGTPEIFFGFMTLVGLGNGLTIPNATAGALSVRPHLAGTAAGLSGAIMLGGGAGLSALAGALLVPGSGANPLIWLMFITSIAAIAAIWWVIHRERLLAK